MPTWIAYPVLAFTALVVLGRAALNGDARSSRRVTAALGFLFLSGLLRERAIQLHAESFTSAVINVQLTRQISTVMLMLAMVPLVVMGARWVIGTRSEPWNRWIYVLAGLSSAALLAVGTRARASGNYIDVTTGWETIVYFGIFSVWTAAMASLYLGVAVRELRRGSLPRQFIVMIAALALLSLWGVEESMSIAASGVAAGIDVARSFVLWRVAANENNLIYILLLAAAYAAVPPLHRVSEYGGVDRWSRACKTLSPMWSDLTSACPEVLLHHLSANLSPRHRAHRMCVEIRDALSVLGRFHTVRPAEGNAAVCLAISIAASADRRRSGELPGQFHSFAVVSAAHLSDEVHVLAVLAKHWPASAESFERIKPLGESI
ncbi:hypothetical protein QMK17_22845 [Rhodococcus sp. G-MC3]|uniref:DUF6545 domain-containing protein n=1 Tax=Rhodococcus sp. G-MC3 TaxID=3046209 RepID=UPI0024BA06F1|nr:DUF6545 domain-containing protein [Rhodococcus sp. G-MC3]MDJ0396160.1 hypothetical protein [Rhodococcus sp. G-MC3]